jgi:serine carboxypeptidase-like clade 2
MTYGFVEDRAGYYVPQLSRLIHRHNQVVPAPEKINFQGFMVGNPVIDAYNDNWGYIEYLYYHAMISDQTYSQMRTVCNFTHDNVPLSDDCIQLLYYQADNEYGAIDPYSIYAPACTSNTSTNHSTRKKELLFNPVSSLLMPISCY